MAASGGMGTWVVGFGHPRHTAATACWWDPPYMQVLAVYAQYIKLLKTANEP